MAEPLTITLKTITPLWTGGVDGTCNRLHATGIIGSLRWWYEAIVRGLGGYVNDPTASDSAARGEFDTPAYERAKRNGATDDEALREGLKTVCPVSYLFGATGWARLFRLQVIDAPTTQLHFRTTVGANKSWLSNIFGGESQNINNCKVPYGEIQFRFVPRGHDVAYTRSQFALALRFAAQYGGLGAKLQHGFGQIALTLPLEMARTTVISNLAQLADRIGSDGLHTSGPAADTPFDLRNFVSLTYEVPDASISTFTAGRAHLGSSQKRNATNYLPCAFDLRYKGSDNWGMRRWLEDPNRTKKWSHADVNMLMGASKKKGEAENDEDRQASRLCFGMPYRVDAGPYRLRVFGFAPPGILSPEELRDLCNEYIQHALDIQPERVTLGKDLIAEVQGGRR